MYDFKIASLMEASLSTYCVHSQRLINLNLHRENGRCYLLPFRFTILYEKCLIEHAPSLHKFLVDIKWIIMKININLIRAFCFGGSSGDIFDVSDLFE